MNVVAFTGGRHVPGARFRVRQYIPKFLTLGIALRECPALFGQYPPKGKLLRPVWLAASLAERGLQALVRRRYDAVLLQRELISTLLTAERFCKRPRILDVDDAIWLHPRGNFAGRLASLCDAVVCGNAYLADYFSRFCSVIHVVPTALDTQRFQPAGIATDRAAVIGWSGISPNLPELTRIEPALFEVLTRIPDARLRVVCDQPPVFQRIAAHRVEYLRWAPEIEVSALQGMSVGLMPLTDSEWSRGKCAFKMLTYMACGVPVVVSPVGMNAEVLAMGAVGYAAKTESDWVESLIALLSKPADAMRMGAVGRWVIEQTFSVDVLAGKYARILHAAVG